jgi:hypothetical protein
LAEADRLANVIDQRLAASGPSFYSPLAQLAPAFSLDRAALDLLLLCYLGERHERYRRLHGYLQDDASRDRPSVELALRVVGGLGRAIGLLGTAAPLRRWHLLVPGGADDAPFFARPLQLDERVLEFLEGGATPDARVAPLLLQPRAREPTPPAVALTAMSRWLERQDQGGGLLLLSGADGSGRLALAREAARRSGLGVLVLDQRRLIGLTERSGLVVNLAMREALMQQSVLVLANADPVDASSHGFPPGLLEALQSMNRLVVLMGETLPEPTLRQAPKGWLHLRLLPPTFSERRAMWERLIDGHSEGGTALASELAGKFDITEGAATDALAAAQALALAGEGNGQLSEAHLLEAARRCSAQRLLRFGLRIEPREATRFDDLVLPAPQHRQLQEVRARIRLRHKVVQELGFHRRLRLGRGFVVLFAGPSGVGKTMAAELLAKEQGIDLYKVDLALVVSKYVGETEKHLRQVFAEARAINAVIFFDEADALFGKRGEVKDARDRWANLEVNYLLQQVEEHDGVVVLATNLRQNLDEAFLRRIQAVIEFPFPDTEARLRLWRGMWPSDFAPPPEAELATIAGRLKLTGGAIRNIALDAAFRAVAASEVALDGRRSNGRITINLRDIVAAAAREYQKHGRPVTGSEFGPQWHSWVREDLF